MVVTPGKKCRMTCDILSFILCIVVMLFQHLLFDYYFVRYLNEPYWYSWLAGDVILLGIMIWLLVIAIKYNQRCMEELCTSDANIKYAFIGWFAYSVLLVAKVSVTFCLYYTRIPIDDFFGRHIFKLNLGLAAVVFLFLIEAHHYTQLNSTRQTYLSYLQTAITLDVVDTIYFLEMLWLNKQHDWQMEKAMFCLILTFGCTNLVLPTFALLKLRYRKMPQWLPLGYEKMYSLFYVLYANVPYLAVRIYLYVTLVRPHEFRVEFNAPSADNDTELIDIVNTHTPLVDHDMSILVVKNVLMIYIALKEVYTRVQYCRHKSAMRHGGSGSGNGEKLIVKTDDEERLDISAPAPPAHQNYEQEA